MANQMFDMPPVLMGDEKNQAQQLYRHLVQMSEQLNEALESLTLDNFAQEERTMLLAAADKESTTQEITSAKNALRSMIIKTADIVRVEMQELSTELQGQYTAISNQFGTLQVDLSNRITANAEGIEQNYEYYERLQDATDENKTYITRINERIYSGLLGFNNDGIPIYGIAIGEGVTAYDAEGNPYLNTNARSATFTKEKLSFWQGTKELAYFSDRKMYITRAEVLNEMIMGRYTWLVQADGSLGLIVNDI